MTMQCIVHISSFLLVQSLYDYFPVVSKDLAQFFKNSFVIQQYTHTCDHSTHKNHIIVFLSRIYFRKIKTKLISQFGITINEVVVGITYYFNVTIIKVFEPVTETTNSASLITSASLIYCVLSSSSFSPVMQ